MAGSKAGGIKAAATNKARHGADFYQRLGSAGGKIGRTGGFFANRELASKVGRKGGLISRRDIPLSKEQRQEILNILEQKERIAS
jgi:general stress protein YciG